MDRAAVLFVDDEAGVVDACQRVLRNSDFEILTTTSAVEAIRIVESRELSVVISDQHMPELDGGTLLRRVKETQPDAVRIMLTGHAVLNEVIDAINEGEVYRFLTKPWDARQLKATVENAVQHYAIIQENRRLQLLTKCQNDELRLLNEELEFIVLERTQQITDLNSRLTVMLKGALQVFAQLMSVTSSTMGNHSRRVADIAVIIGDELELSLEDSRQLEAAALLHDIGKLTVAPSILNKPLGFLTPDERSVLQNHVHRGEAILKAIPFFEDAALFVRHHHERFGGKGYPDRLKGEEIPLGARIISVADAWDKSLNDKKEFADRTAASVLETLRKQSPELYDPAVIDALESGLERNKTAALRLDSTVEVSVDDLKPGMVLAADVRTPTGAMLVPAKVTLTRDCISRLRGFAGSSSTQCYLVYRTISDGDAQENQAEMAAL